MSSKPKILIVDDEPDLAELLQFELEDSNYETEVAGNVDKALQKVDSGSFQVIITDFTMPGKSGLDLAKAIKARNLNIPIILLTGHTELSKEELGRVGIVAIMPKPVDFEQLLEVVAEKLSDAKSAA